MTLTKRLRYYDGKQKMIMEEWHVDENNIYQGSYKTYYSNRRLSVSCNYINGKKCGVYKVWHKNGKMYEQMFLIDNVLHGEYKSWGQNGELIIHSYFYHGTNITEEVMEKTKGDPVLIKLHYDFRISSQRKIKDCEYIP